VAPAASTLPKVGQYVPGAGLIQSQPDPAKVSASVQDFLQKDESYKAWNTQKSFANSFDTIAKEQHAIGADDPNKWTGALSRQNPQNVNDLGLAENVIKMFDPGNAIRPFKLDKETESQPVGELLKNAGQEISRTGSLTPGTRQRLIHTGYETIDSKEKAAAPAVSTAMQQIPIGMSPDARTGRPLGLSADDVRLLNGIPFRAATAPAPAPAGIVKHIPAFGGLPPMVKDANGNYWPAAQ
jgi:hypothetical protein